MEERSFVDRARMPTDEAIKLALPKLYKYYKAIDDWAADCVKEWKFYNRRYGWSLKVSWRKKPLYWLIVYKGYFHVGFSIGKEEKEDFLAMDLGEMTKRAIVSAKEFPDGFPIEFAIKDEKSFGEALVLLKKQMELLG
jgi:hypothetical protein